MMITNGQQTLGVGLPWATAACLARPRDKLISVSGDGGFLFSRGELETAVRLNCHFVHMIWCDGHYDMVAFQERMKYGRTSGCDFGPVETGNMRRPSEQRVSPSNRRMSSRQR